MLGRKKCTTPFYGVDNQTRTLGGRLFSQRFLKTKDSQFFCQQTNSIHKFNGCFLRGQVSTNGFKVFVPLP